MMPIWWLHNVVMFLSICSVISLLWKVLQSYNLGGTPLFAGSKTCRQTFCTDQKLKLYYTYNMKSVLHA